MAARSCVLRARSILQPRSLVAELAAQSTGLPKQCLVALTFRDALEDLRRVWKITYGCGTLPLALYLEKHPAAARLVDHAIDPAIPTAAMLCIGQQDVTAVGLDVDSRQSLTSAVSLDRYVRRIDVLKVLPSATSK